MLAARVARKPLSATSSGSPLFMRVKSMCIPRHSFCRSAVNSANCSRYPSRSARGSVSSSPASSSPLNSVVVLERELDLLRVEDLEHHHLVLLVAQVAQALLDAFDVVEEVAEQDDQAAVVQLLGQLVEDPPGVGLLAAAGVIDSSCVMIFHCPGELLGLM